MAYDLVHDLVRLEKEATSGRNIVPSANKSALQEVRSDLGIFQFPAAACCFFLPLTSFEDSSTPALCSFFAGHSGSYIGGDE